MQNSLGIVITDKLIKYAKIQKDNNNIKILSNGVKFYDNLELDSTINKIIEESSSTGVPISINVDEAKYYFFDIFSLANKSYVDKAIDTEFESFCGDNKLNNNAYEYRYSFAQNIDNPDKSKVILIYNTINNLQEKYNKYKNYKLGTAMPVSCVLSNLCNINSNQSVMIVNLEEKTTISTIINKALYSVDILNEGMGEAFDKINEKENDYLKTYEVCKNTTIYTADTLFDGTGTNNEYLSYIVPSLYKVIQEIQNISIRYGKIEKIYLTGFGTVVNNVDLYFQEYFKDSKVEILKPYFLSEVDSVNIKDYIEVNSAIALAMQNFGYGIQSLNFRKEDKFAGIKKLLTMDVGSAISTRSLKPKKSKTSGYGSEGKGKNDVVQKLKNINLKDLNLKDIKFKEMFSKLGNIKINPSIDVVLDKIEATLISDCIIIFLIIVFFSGVMTYLMSETNSKIAQTSEVIKDTQQQISQVNADDQLVNSKTMDYQRYKMNLQNASSAVELKRSRKNQITTLLNNLVYNIPKEVTLLEIKNTEKQSNGETIQHITISAQSKKYEQLAYFKAKLKNANILDNIVSTEGTKDGEYVKVSIEGDLRTY